MGFNRNTFFSVFVILLLIATGLLVNTIWFKPISIRVFYDRIFLESALRSPETITALGVPVLYDLTKDELTDVSDSAQREELALTKKAYETLLSYDYESQSEENKLNTDILSWYLKQEVENEPYFYHDYPVNQMSGIQNTLPSLLVNAHRLENESDVTAYIARLELFPLKFDQVIEGLKIRQEKGIVPPRFVIKDVITEMEGFVSTVENNILYTNLSDKLNEIDGLDEDEKAHYRRLTHQAVEKSVFAAYGSLINYFQTLEKVATTDDGVWKLPDGDNYYRHRLKSMTTTDLSPDQVHEIGLSEVARIEQAMWAILEAEGYAQGERPVGEVVQAVFAEERFLLPTTDEGRELILADYRRILDEANAGLDDLFDVRPRSGLEVKRVPEFRQEGAAGAYYNGPAMDGSRGGTFFVNLRDLRELPEPGRKTLSYHEGIPGHHFQIAIQAELEGVPVFRTLGLFTAFTEGWALYAEKVMFEEGFYDNDPYGDLGRLQAEMFRSVRLVVDTGIHSKRWTREQAVDYMVANTGMTTSEVETEIDRYIVWPGQACAYKIGMLKILELRDKAKTALGDEFDIKAFHNVVLKNGAVPLDVLEKLIGKYIVTVQGSA